MDDKFKKDLIEILDQQFEEKFIRLFNQGFEEVIAPSIDGLEKEIKGELNGVKSRLDTLEIRVEQMDRKLDVFTAKVTEHGKRLTIIESIPSIAHQIKK